MISKYDTIIHAWQYHVSNTPQKIAYIFLEDGYNESASISYIDLEMRAQLIARELIRLNLSKKNVLLLYPTGIEFIAAYLACIYAGSIVILAPYPTDIKSDMQLSRLNYIMNNSCMSAILSDEKFFELYDTHNKLITRSACLKIVSQNIRGMNTNTQLYNLNEIEPTAIAHVLYTSGTTGNPKGVMLSNKAVAFNLYYTATQWQMDQMSINVSWGSPSTSSGLMPGILMSAYCGATAVMFPIEIFLKKPLAWLYCLSKYRGTHSASATSGYSLCNEALSKGNHQFDLHCWKIAVVGGEPINHTVLTMFVNYLSTSGFQNSRFITAYGMTEAAGLISSSKIDEAIPELTILIEDLGNRKIKFTDDDTGNVINRKLYSVGNVALGVNLKLISSKTDEEVAENEIGEVLLSTPSLYSGYLHDKVIPKEFISTGDLGFLNKNNLYLLGRVNEIIQIAERYIFPQDIEKLIETSYLKCRTGMNAAFMVENNLIVLQEIRDFDNTQNYCDIIECMKIKIKALLNIDVSTLILLKENRLPRSPAGKILRAFCKDFYLKYYNTNRTKPHGAQFVEYPCAWKKNDIVDRHDWCENFTEGALKDLDDFKEISITTNTFNSLSTFTCLSSLLSHIANQLENKFGFFLLRGFPVIKYSPDITKYLYMGLSSFFGKLLEQDSQGKLLMEIKNRDEIIGNPNTRGTSGSNELPFHSDRCDITMLICMKEGAIPGQFKVLSSANIHNNLLLKYPHLLSVSYEPFFYERTMWEPKTALPYYSIPVFSIFENFFASRYLYDSIKQAQLIPDVPRLTNKQSETLQIINQFTADPINSIEFLLQPGDIVFLNNFVTWHGRTAYKDDTADPSKTRLLYRLWLKSNIRRPLSFEFKKFFNY